MLNRLRLSSFQYLTYFLAAKSRRTRKKEIQHEMRFFIFCVSCASSRLPHYLTIRSTATLKC